MVLLACTAPYEARFAIIDENASDLWAVATAHRRDRLMATVVPLAAIAAVLALNRKWTAMATPARA